MQSVFNRNLISYYFSVGAAVFFEQDLAEPFLQQDFFDALALAVPSFLEQDLAQDFFDASAVPSFACSHLEAVQPSSLQSSSHL